MGSEIRPARAGESEAPDFLAWALKGPDEAPLQRIQMIKGWYSNGESHEQIHDIVCSDGAVPDPQSHRFPDNGATVDLNDCSISKNKGDAEMALVWHDPDFKADEHGFYYLRVIQNPTCRWST